MAKIVNGVTLEELNANLLNKLNRLVDDSDSENILEITEAVAKLNASLRNNNQFTQPETPEEKMARQQQEVFGDVLKGEIVEGESITK